MDRQGKHLSGAERAVIFSEDLRGSSQRQIARGEVFKYPLFADIGLVMANRRRTSFCAGFCKMAWR